MRKTKEYLRSNGHKLGRMLRAPYPRWRSVLALQNSLALGHLLLLADKCIHSTAGPGWSKEKSLHLAKKSAQLATVRFQQKGKTKTKALREVGETPLQEAELQRP